MSEYLLLYRATPEARAEALATPEKARQSLDKWRAWMDAMAKKGQLKNAGMPLEFTGKVVRGKAKQVIDGPYAESKELIGGFSIVDAKDAEEAARIASGCPILEGGGSVEVRPVRPFEP